MVGGQPLPGTPQNSQIGAGGPCPHSDKSWRFLGCSIGYAYPSSIGTQPSLCRRVLCGSSIAVLDSSSRSSAFYCSEDECPGRSSLPRNHSDRSSSHGHACCDPSEGRAGGQTSGQPALLFLASACYRRLVTARGRHPLAIQLYPSRLTLLARVAGNPNLNHAANRLWPAPGADQERPDHCPQPL